MTDNGIKLQMAEEQERHNKEMEKLEKMKKAIEGAAGAGQAIGTLIALLNDPEWYKRVDSLVDSVTRIPFHRRKGYPLSGNSYTAMGIAMKHYWAPTIGTEKGVLENSPVMIAIKELFAAVRGENSGATNYDAVDLGIVTLSLDSIVTLWFETLRALRAAAKTEELNPFTRRHVCNNLLNYDTDVLNANRERYISVLNKVAQDINTLFIPGNLSYFKKHAFLAQNIFCEYDDALEVKHRQNFHAFTCWGYFKYDEANGELDFNDYPTGTRTPEWLQSVFSSMIQPLLHSSAVEIMTGDIKKAVQMGRIAETALFKLPAVTLEDSYAQCYVYSKDMLEQIKNMTILPDIYQGQRSTELSIHQVVLSGVPYIYQGTLDSNSRPNGIRFNNPVNGVSSGDIADYTMFVKGKLFRSDHDTPDVDEILEGSRLMYMTDLDDTAAASLTSPGFVTLKAHGSEIVFQSRLVIYHTQNEFKQDNANEISIYEWYNAGNISTLQRVLATLQAFKYAPIIRAQQRSIVGVYPFVNYEAYNSITFDEPTLKALHECALRSEFCFDFKGSAPVNEDKGSGSSKSSGKGRKKKGGRKGGKPKPKKDENKDEK